MNKWGIVKRLTLKQKGELVKWALAYRLTLERTKDGYVFLDAEANVSDYVIRRCPSCAHVIVMQDPKGIVHCTNCREYLEV